MVNLDGSGCCYVPIFSFGFFCEVRIGATMYFANVAYVEDTLRTLIEETWFWQFLSLVKFHDRLLVRTSLQVISIDLLLEIYFGGCPKETAGYNVKRMIREGVWHGTCRSIVTVCVCLVRKHLGHERYQPLATKFVVAYREIVLGLGTFKRTIQQAQQPLEQEEKHSDYKGCSRFHGRAFIQVLLYKSSFDL